MKDLLRLITEQLALNVSFSEVNRLVLCRSSRYQSPSFTFMILSIEGRVGGLIIHVIVEDLVALPGTISELILLAVICFCIVFGLVLHGKFMLSLETF